MSSSEDIQDYVENVPEGKPLNDQSLVAPAASVHKQARTVKGVVSQIRSHLQDSETHGKIRRFHVPPAWQEVFAGASIPDDKDWFVQTVDYFKQIVARYHNGDFDPIEIEKDILRISGQLVYFSSWVNYMDANATKVEGDRKAAELRALAEVRSWAETHGISIRQLGADTAKALAAEATQDQGDFSNTFRITADTIKGFYYAVKEFMQLLDRISQRAQHERFESRRHGAHTAASEPVSPRVHPGGVR